MTRTEGICITFEDLDIDNRMFFFELDGDMSELGTNFLGVLSQYIIHGLDVYVHKTGKGYHFLSPTIIKKELWQQLMRKLRHFNPKCPMTTLRWLPNKYPTEPQVWFIGMPHYAQHRTKQNSKEMSNLLNHLFHTEFKGEITATPKRVHYDI